MFVIEVAPLIRGGQLDRLSYYSPVAYEIGSLLKVPVRNKVVTSMVLSVTPLSVMKTAVRTATFSLRKLPEQEQHHQLSASLIKTAQSLYKELPASLGAILFSLLPNSIRDGEEDYPIGPDSLPANDKSEVTVLYGLEEERWRTYKGRVREAFAHRGSVLFVVPTLRDLEKATEILMGGIEDRTIVFSTKQSKKSLKKAYEAFNDFSASKLVITTPAHAFLDRYDFTDVIIEGAQSGHYRSRTRPYIDFKEALIIHSRHSGRNVLLGDIVHKSEDEHLRRQEIYFTDGEVPNRIVFDNTLQIVGAKDKPTADSPFSLFTPTLKTAIQKTLAAKQNVFLYSARRGLAPVVACGDCGYIFRCPDSGTPYSLFRTKKNGEEKRWFLSTTSGRRVKAATTCTKCGSWRLRERGIGIQHVYDELVKEFDKEKIFLFDHTTASTPSKTHALIGDFYDTKGAILIGTAMAMPYLEKPVSLSAITSMEAVRSIPTWRTDEECFSLVMRLRNLTSNEVIIQTRTDTDPLLDIIKTAQVNAFYNEELELRQALSYPPFSNLVHLTMSGPVAAVKSMEVEITEILKQFKWHFYSAPDSTDYKTTRYGLCRVPKENWPDEELTEALRQLPPSVRIEINPNRIV